MGKITTKQQSTPTTDPAIGYQNLYCKADGYWYSLDENGVEVQISGPGSFPVHADTHKGGGADEIDAATTGVNGLMSSADKSKLDGVDVGADVTADNAPQAHAASHVGSDAIQDATASQKGLATDTQITKLDGIESSADVTDTTNVASAGAVMKTLFDANTVLSANSDNTPVALAVAVSRILGRKATGDIGALTAAEVRTILNVLDGAGTFGSEFSQGSSDGVSTTTSETYIQKLRHTTGTLPSGNYLIFWACEYYDNYGDDGQIRVQLNDTLDIAESTEYDDVWPNYRSASGFYYAPSISGVQNIDIDYRSGAVNSTQYIRRARVVVFRVS